MRYNNAFSLWFPRDSQAIVPIELIEISPSSSKPKPAKPQLKAKTVSLKPAANQQSSTVTPRNENSGKIDFGASRKQRKRNTFVSKSNTQLVPKQSVPTFTPTPTPTPTATPTPTPTPKPTSFGNLRWKRERERISLGKPTPLPKFTPVEPRQPIGEEEQIPSRRTPRQPIGEEEQIPSRRTPRQPIGEEEQIPSRRTPRQPTEEQEQIPSRRTPRQPTEEQEQIPSRRNRQQPTEEQEQIPSRRNRQQPTEEQEQIPSRRNRQQPTPEEEQIPQSRKTPQPATGGGLIAISRFLTPNELTPDEQRILIRDPLPEGLILPKHIGSNSKQIDSGSIKPNSDLPEKEFLATLVIDKAGNFVQAVVEDPAIAPEQRRKYQEFANSIFQGEKFQPARSTNGTPVPELVNRFVRIKIQRR
jgi:hypothetical protein